MFRRYGKKLLMFASIIVILSFIFPVIPVDGDGCYIPVKPNISISEPGQKAVIAWNGTHERMYLSVDIWAEEPTEGLHVVPFPSMPTVNLGNVSIFENATEEFTDTVHIVRKYGWYYDGSAGGSNSSPSIDIKFHDILGVHDLTVIKVKDVDGFKREIESILTSLNISMESWPDGLDQVICNYTSRGFPYFAIDRFSVEPEELSIDPIVYQFETDRVIFPLEISSPLSGFSTVKLSIITPESIPLDLSGADRYFGILMEGRLLLDQVLRIDPTLVDMFDSCCFAIFLEGKVDLGKLRGDLVLEPFQNASWMLLSDRMEVSFYTDENGIDRSAMFLWSHINDDTSGRMASAETGEILWEEQDLFRTDEEGGYCNGIILEDLDDDNVPDLIVLELISGNQSVSRFDGRDGSLIWRTSLPMMLTTCHMTTEGEDGDVLLVIPSYYGVASIRLEDGSLTYVDSLSDAYIHSIDLDRAGLISSPSGDILILPDTRNDHLALMDPKTLELILCEYGYGYLDHFFYKKDNRELILCHKGESLILLDPQNGFLVEELNVIEGIYVDHYYEDGDHFLIFLKDRRTAVKFDLNHKKMVWRTTFMKMEGDYGGLRLHTDDINGDDRLDIMLYYDHSRLDWSSYYSNADENSVYTVILDGADGSPILTEHRRVLHPGLDLDGDGEMEVLMDSPDEVQIVDPETGLVEKSFIKEHVDALVRCPIVEDLNDDGVEDLVLAMFGKSWDGYHYGLAADELVVIDGQLCEQSGEIEVTGSIRDIDVIDPVYGGNSLLLQMGDQVLQFPFSMDLDLHAGLKIVDRGEGTTLILSARDGSDPMEGYQVTWSSTSEGDLFSTTQEWVPGLYMAHWTPSSDLVGEVEITAMIRSGDMLIHWETNTTITVNGDVERVLPEWLEFNTWLSPDDRLTPGNSTYVFVSVQGVEEEVYNISVEEVRGDGTIAGGMLVFNNVWAYRYWPCGEAGTRSLLVKVSHGDDLLFVDVLTVELIVPEAEEPILDPPIEEPPREAPPKLKLLSRTAYPGSMLSLLVLSDEDLTLYYFEATDHNVGGFFTPVEQVVEGIWSCHYLVPEIEGSLLLTIRIMDSNGPAWLMEDTFQVISRPTVEVPSTVEPSFSMSQRYTSEGDESTIKISLNDEMGEVPITTFDLLSIPDGTSLVSIQLEEDHLVLVIVSDGTSGGQIEIKLADGLGRSANLTIGLMWSITPNRHGSGYDLIEDYDESPKGQDGLGEIGPLMVIFMSAVILILGMVIILLIRRRETE